VPEWGRADGRRARSARRSQGARPRAARERGPLRAKGSCGVGLRAGYGRSGQGKGPRLGKRSRTAPARTGRGVDGDCGAVERGHGRATRRAYAGASLAVAARQVRGAGRGKGEAVGLTSGGGKRGRRGSRRPVEDEVEVARRRWWGSPARARKPLGGRRR